MGNPYSWGSDEEQEEEELEEYDNPAYLEEAEYAHGMELWSLARIFESPELEEDFDTRYSDVSVELIMNWKVVKFELGRYDAKYQYWRAGVDMFAVVR